MRAHLSIRGLELYVKLGWSNEERSQRQLILTDIDITLPTPPEACVTDQLANTICYSEISADLRTHLDNDEFHLVEALARKIYCLVKSRLPDDASAVIHITKHPKIAGLTGGVCFSYGDE